MVAARIKGSVRDADLVARLGGDEFVILIEEHSNLAEVGHVAQKVLSSMEDRYLLDGREVNLTASIGISVYPQDGTDLNTLVKNADIAMYQAKELGRNNFQFYAASQNQMTLKRLDLEARLARAIDRNEFVLHYQPMVDLLDRNHGRCRGAGALERIPSMALPRRANLFRWPRKPAPSCRSASGCWIMRVRNCRSGTPPVCRWRWRSIFRNASSPTVTS